MIESIFGLRHIVWGVHKCLRGKECLQITFEMIDISLGGMKV